MFVSSPACDSGAPLSRDSSQNEPVSSSSRCGSYGVSECIAAPLLKQECADGANEQTGSVGPAEPLAQEGLKKTTAATCVTNAISQHPTAAQEDKYAVKTEISAATVTDEKSPFADDGSDPALNHDGCYKLGREHTDACWNDPRWNERNKKKREELEQRIQAGTYCDKPFKCIEAMSESQRFKMCVAGYASNSSGLGYTNIRITKSEDGALVANINRDFEDLFCKLFWWNGDECVLSGYTELSPLVVNLETGKIYSQRGDLYAPYELEWRGIEASPDGQTFLVGGCVGGGFPAEYRFYNAAKPDEGFRYLPCDIMVVPRGQQISGPDWDTDLDGRTTVTLTVKGCDEDSVDENGDPVVFVKTFRREETRMVEVASKTIPAELSSDEED